MIEKKSPDAPEIKNTADGDLELARRAPSSVSAYFVLFTLYFAMTPYYQDHPTLVVIVEAIVIIVVGIRLYLAKKMLKNYHQNPELWRRTFAAGAYLSALIWGIFSYITFYHYELTWVSVIMMQMTCGIASGGTNSLSSSKEISRNFAILILLPMIIWGIVDQTRMSYTISFITVIYLGVLTSIGKQINAWYWENIKNLKLFEEARDHLWGEMQLAKKIQTVLLPQKPQISGYEIAAHMAPADEIGGDYYDIINAGSIDWVIIGDVSGHGIPAGLIMMMVQTSIHVTLTQNPDIPPSQLLTIINETITYNIKQLGEDKYMTITVMAAVKDGKFNFSGLHQDILIYKKETKQVITQETNGFWIGIVDDIGDHLTDDSLTLDKGDSLLIFTDGITEARYPKESDKPFSFSDSLYGAEKLQSVFKENGDKSPEEIKNAVLESLEGYEIDDDITMVILKRK